MFRNVRLRVTTMSSPANLQHSFNLNKENRKNKIVSNLLHVVDVLRV